MTGRGAFDATYLVVALDDDQVPACKRALVSELRGRATELRVLVHPTERDDAPDAVAELDAVDPAQAVFADDESAWSGIERRGSLPAANHVVDAVLAAMDDDGSFPVTSLCFRSGEFDAVVTSSSSHAHVGKLDCEASTDSDNPELLDALSDARARTGVVVPAGPVVGWEQDGTYLELDGAECCVYAERPADLDDRTYTTHTCHDLTRLVAMRADSASGHIELEWRETDSLFGRAFEFVFGRPPTELAVPDEEFETVRGYLEQFLPDRSTAVF